MGPVALTVLNFSAPKANITQAPLVRRAMALAPQLALALQAQNAPPVVLTNIKKELSVCNAMSCVMGALARAVPTAWLVLSI